MLTLVLMRMIFVISQDNVFIKVHDFDATLAVRPYVDVVVTMPTSPDLVENMSPDPFDTFHTSLSCPLPSPSPECHNLLLAKYHVML